MVNLGHERSRTAGTNGESSKESEFLGPRVLEQYPVDDFSSPYRALAEVFGDFVFVCPTRFAANQHALNGRTTWLYHFTHVTNFGELRDLGAFHGSELAFVFGTLGLFWQPSPEEALLSEQMQNLWASFAIEGAPAAGDLQWDQHDPASQNGLELSPNPLMIEGYRAEYCDFWAQFF